MTFSIIEFFYTFVGNKIFCFVQLKNMPGGNRKEGEVQACFLDQNIRISGFYTLCD